MKKSVYIIILVFVIISCSSDDRNQENKYEFILEYSTTILVGGVVGITDRTFEVGEIYTGTDQGNSTITIRIAEHSELNEDCPNSWCYQELLNVPKKFLKEVE